MRPENIRITQRIENSEIRNQIWEIYRKSFDGQEIKCAQNQKCYDQNLFLATLTDPDYFKYYLEIDGRVIAYMLSTNNLQKASITYFNPERYLMMFPEFAPDRIYYFTSLSVIDKNSFRYLSLIISEGLKHIAEKNGIWAFDFSHETVSNLGRAFIKIADKLHKQGKFPYALKYVKVGAQEFGAMIPLKKPEST